MNKKKQLIADVLGDGDGGAFALQAAALARRRRTTRRTLTASGALAALAAAVTLATHPAPQVAVQPALSPPFVQIISDQELIAALKDEPVIFIKADNHIT